jgi:uncharacterized membrane protein
MMTTATDYTRTDADTFRDRRIGEGEWRAGAETGNGRRHGDSADGERLARFLGLFSIGLGAAQILAPGGVARAIGVADDDRNRKAMLAVGLREIACGIGLLTRPRPAEFAWGRVGGDVMDLALLGRALRSDRNDRNRVATATAAVIGVTLLDFLASNRLSQGDGAAQGRAGTERQRAGAIRVKKAITVYRPAEECYRFWRNFENLPDFMAHLEVVRVIDDRRSHWVARAPLGAVVEWDAEIVEERPNELIAWRSLEKADVPNWGQVRFVPAPGNRGTEVRVELSYDPPGGIIGATIAKLFGEEPSQQVDGDLRRFKQVMEVGEVVHSESSIYPRPHPAQPPAEVPPRISKLQGAVS